MSTKSFYGMRQGSFYGGGMYGNGQSSTEVIEKELGPDSIVSFNDGLKNKPLKECVVNIEPVQAGSGDPSPNNVRAISGWTGVNIYISPTNDSADGRTYSVTLPNNAGTVYGGKIDLVHGTLTVEMARVDLGTLTWKRAATKVDGHYRFQSSDLPGPAKSYPSGALSKCKCEMYKTATSDEVYTANDGVYITSSGKAMIYDSRYYDATVTAFSTTVSGVYLVYELADPIVYQITPVSIETLSGNNNIWADTGDITIKYLAKK